MFFKSYVLAKEHCMENYIVDCKIHRASYGQFVQYQHYMLRFGREIIMYAEQAGASSLS